MSVFSTHPIKINIIKDNVIEKRVVFVGSVPKEVETELRKIENKQQPNNKNLEKYYGSGWHEKLGVGITKKGGNELDVLQQPGGQEVIEIGLHEDKDIVEEDKDIVEELTIDELEDVFMEIDKSYEPPKRDMKSSDITFIVNDMGVYPEDNFFELKKKIFIACNVPIYRQHLWVETDSITRPINYNVFSGNNLIQVNINDVYEVESKIEDIPISQTIYNQKDFIRIDNMDTFNTLGNYYHKYGVTTYNLMDLANFVDPSNQKHKSLTRDSNKMDIVYYGFVILYWPIMSRSAFDNYLSDETYFQKVYPLLHPDVLSLSKTLSMEKKILDVQYDIFENKKIKKIQDKIESAITYAVINVINHVDVYEKHVSLRNLFDQYELSPYVRMCKCHLEYNKKYYVLEKYYEKTNHTKEKIPKNSIMFHIYPDQKSMQYINFILMQNGSYITKSKWREDEYYTYEDILQIISISVNQHIAKINSFGSTVNIKDESIEKMTEKNAQLLEINISVLYKSIITTDSFLNFKKLIQDYRTADFLKFKVDDGVSLETYFRKGMFKFDSTRLEKYTDTANYYEHLTDGDVRAKWQKLFEDTRLTKIQHRFSDIRFETSGLKEKEFPTYYKLLVTLIYLFEQTSHKSSKEPKKIIKKLKTLKEQDPVLYDFKKIYNSDVVYSKICQKPHQPVLLNESQFEDLGKEAKEKTTKYWNFTDKKPVYYSCPSPKYKYIKFIVNKHPKKYCIPCCFKKDVSKNKKDPKRIIYDTCMSKKEYVTEKSAKKGSRYIMTYGKNLEEGRLSKLPEETLESLFYDKYSEQYSGIDQECATADGFYLFGVSQNTASVSNIGFLFCLSHALGVDIKKLILNTVSKLKDNPKEFFLLLEGKITNYYASLNELIDKLLLISEDKSVDFIDSTFPWNNLFMSIAKKYYGVNVILFTDYGNIKLTLPTNLVDPDKFVDVQHTNLIVLNKKGKYYPIYLLNAEVFHKTGIVDKKLFSHDSSIIITIKMLLKKYFTSKKHPEGIPYENLDLYVIEKFIKNSSYTVVKMFVNSSNLCNGLLLTSDKYSDRFFYEGPSKPKGLLYVPVHDSLYTGDFVDYKPFYRREYSLSIHDLNKFLQYFNKWVERQSIELKVDGIYPMISVKKWIAVKKVIGFRSNDLNFYFNEIEINIAKKLKNVEIHKFMYDPDDINEVIYKRPAKVKDALHKNIGSNYHEYYGYKLFLGEMNRYFTKTRNVKKRTLIKNILSKDIKKNLPEALSKINDVVDDKDDIKKIKRMMSNYINIHQDKKYLLNQVMKERYFFDDVNLNKIREMNNKDSKSMIYKISKNLVHISDKKIDTFPNVYKSCSEKIDVDYCHNSKLILPKKSYDNYVDIFSSDIRNPLKSKIIFTPLLSDSVISYFRFIRYPRETIFVSIAAE